MADAASVRRSVEAAPSAIASPRHHAFVRVTHWISAACFFALLITGIEIVISHPRFYWGEAGNVHTPALFQIPIPSSRDKVPTGYGFVLPDQNGWSRYLHFQSAWGFLFAGLVYVAGALATRHFGRNLLPAPSDFRPRAMADVIAGHLRLRTHSTEASAYNGVQRIAYSAVIFLLVPLTIWTGLAMSPAVVSALPLVVTIFGGQQSARTIHFFLAVALFAFTGVHVVLVTTSGFRKRMLAMLRGK